jgi:hypothetical protein
MATPVRDVLHSDTDNLSDLVGLFVSIKNKYGLVPFDIAAESYPIPNALTARYLVDSITITKITNFILDTPRLRSVSLSPRGLVKSGQFELSLTLGG